MKRVSENNYSRFRFAREPLDAIDRNEETHKPDFPFAGELNKRRYPVRALRYWWLNMVIHEEARRLHRPPVISDIGCDTGIIKRFILPVEGSRWIGLDIITDRPGLDVAGYDELHQCDFDEGIPLSDSSIDIAIFSHVLEHLPRPEFRPIAEADAVAITGPGRASVINLCRTQRFPSGRQGDTERRRQGDLDRGRAL